MGDTEVERIALSPDERVGIIRRLGPERRFGYVETTGLDGLNRLYIFVAGRTASHRTVALLRVGTRVAVRVVDERIISGLRIISG